MRPSPGSHDERLERLLRHALRGWERVRASSTECERAQRWLEEHPSGWPEVDELWSLALRGKGTLADWLEAGALADSWSSEIPMHSVLSSHPFACLSPWSSPAKSNRS